MGRATDPLKAGRKVHSASGASRQDSDSGRGTGSRRSAGSSPLDLHLEPTTVDARPPGPVSERSRVATPERLLVSCDTLTAFLAAAMNTEREFA